MKSWSKCFYLIVALAIGCLTAWEVWEQDVFWQIRAGDEILRGMGLQHHDQWSYTALGRPWENIQWLATVIIRAAFEGGVVGLIGLRVLLTSAYFFLFMKLLSLGPREKKVTELSKTAAFLATLCVFPMLAFKMEVRSDTFNFLIFGSILYLWRGGRISIKSKIITTILGVLLAANLHAGTAPFIILIAVCAICSSSDLAWPAKICGSIVSSLAIFGTPYGPKIFNIIKYIFFYSDHNFLDNYDHYGLIFNNFAVSNFGIASWTWVPFALVSVFAQLFYSKASFTKTRWFETIFPVATGFLLTGYCIIRMRVFPYHALFFAPYFGSFIRSGLALLGRRTLETGLAISAVVLCGLHFYFFPLHYKWTYSHEAFPVGSTKFLSQHTFQDPMFHTYGFGGYFVWWLREHPDFADTRETIFWDLQRQLLDASTNELKFHELIARYNINTAILPIPPPQYINNMGFLDVFATLLPPDEWALVYFDDISLVYLRRIPQHAAIIASHSLAYLKPNVPPGNYLFSKNRTSEGDRQIILEINRCRTEEPENIHCAIASSIAARQSQNIQNMLDAFQMLKALKWKGKNRPDFNLELETLEKQVTSGP